MTTPNQQSDLKVAQLEKQLQQLAQQVSELHKRGAGRDQRHNADCELAWY